MAESNLLISAVTTTAGIRAYTRSETGAISEWVNGYSGHDLEDHIQISDPQLLMDNSSEWTKKDLPFVKCRSDSLLCFVYSKGNVLNQSFLCEDEEKGIVAYHKGVPESQQIVSNSDDRAQGAALGLATSISSSKAVLLYQGAQGDLNYRTLTLSEGKGDSPSFNVGEVQRLVTAVKRGTKLGVACRKDFQEITLYYQNSEGQLTEIILMADGDKWKPSDDAIVAKQINV